MRLRTLAAYTALAATIALATPAAALYIVTPVTMFADDTNPDNGGTVTFTFAPWDDENRTLYAGATLTLRANDMNGTGTWDVGTVTLDQDARATFAWQLPASADDRNLHVTAMRGEELAAQADVSVGDAEPMMHILAAQTGGPVDDPDTPVDDSDGDLDDGNTQGTPDGAESHSDGKDAPGLFAGLAILALFGVALLARRK